MNSSPTPIRRHRLRTALLIVGGLFVVYLVLGLIFGPGWARHRIERAFAENTHGTLSLGRVGVNPLRLSATLHDVALTGPGRDSLFSVGSLTVDLSLRSLVQRAAVFDRILIDSPALWLVVGRDSTLHWTHLLKATADTARAAREIPRLVVRHFRLRDGRVVFEDSTKRTPYRNEIQPLALELRDFSTLPTDRGTHVVNATFPRGGTLHWEGGLVTRPFGADGHLEVRDLGLRALWDYIKDDVSFGVLRGRLTIATDYRVRTAGDSAGTMLRGGSLLISDAALAAWGGDSAVTTIPSLAVEGVTIDMAKLEARVEQVLWRGGHLRASLAPDTVLNLSHLFEPRGAAARTAAVRPAKPGPPAPAWRVRLDRFAIQDASVGFEDSTQSPPAYLDMDQVSFEVKGVDNGRDLSGSLAASLRLEGSGRVEASGKVAILPVRTDLMLKGSAIPLRPLQAYVDTFVKLDIVRGTGQLEGRMGMNELPGGVFSFRFAGDARLDDVVATDPAAGDDFLRFRSVLLSRALMELGPDRMRLGSVDVREPRATIAMGTHASLNLFRIFPALKPPPPGTDVPVTPFAIGKIQVRNGTLNFVDQTIQPAFRAGFSAINGEIENLSSDSTAEARITLEGRSAGAGPLKITARLRPAAKEPYAHFTFDFGGMDCQELSTYTGKYLGRVVDRGQLGMTLGYDIENRKIKGTNNLRLDQFYLGEKTNSPDATHLPVGLALSLLRDKNGLIEIDVPVQGDLDDPKFKVSGIIWQALLNLITKAAMSPFSLLGKLFGGGSTEDMGKIAFDPGTDSLSHASMEQLGQLAKAATERPALRLNVNGAADSLADRAALAVVALEHRLVTERRAEYFASRVSQPDRAAAAPWPAGERERIMAKLYLNDFGRDTLGARLPNPTRSAGDLRRIGTACERGVEPSLAPLKGSDQVSADAWRSVEARLLAGTHIDRETLMSLAGARAEGIRAALVGSLGVAEDRVFLRPPAWRAAVDGRVLSSLELSGE